MKQKPKNRRALNSKLKMSLTKTRFVGKNIPFINLVLTILAINVALIVGIILLSSKLPPQIPLFYGLPRGERQLSSPTSLILPIALASLFVTTNSIVAYFNKNLFIKNTLIVTSLFSVLLAILTITKILFLMVIFPG